MDTVFNWMVNMFLNEDRIVGILVKLLSHDMVDGKLAALGFKVGSRISTEAREKMDPVNWERIESQIQHRLDTITMNLHKGFDADDAGA